MNLCRSFKGKNKFRVRELSKLIGNLVATFPGVEFGKLHNRGLECYKMLLLKEYKGNFDQVVSLNTKLFKDLDWWIDNLPNAERKIHHGEPELTIRTDASKSGWGATCRGTTTG